jgi:hypothetical protein
VTSGTTSCMERLDVISSTGEHELTLAVEHSSRNRTVRAARLAGPFIGWLPKRSLRGSRCVPADGRFDRRRSRPRSRFMRGEGLIGMSAAKRRSAKPAVNVATATHTLREAGLRAPEWQRPMA